MSARDRKGELGSANSCRQISCSYAERSSSHKRRKSRVFSPRTKIAQKLAFALLEIYSQMLFLLHHAINEF